MSIQSKKTCPECGATLRADLDRGETVCSECATVTSETAIDRGPEWQAFTPRETAERSRVGAPLTATRHDRGLSTEISWQDKDVRGNQLSARKRRQMQRLRKWNKRCQAYSTKEQNLRDGLGEIDRMASALGLPQSVRETASILYRRAQDNELLYGRSVEGATAAALYAAARQEGIPDHSRR